MIGGDSCTQFSHELHTCDHNKRLQELGDAFQVQIFAESSLMVKADLNIPWNKLRTMRRYTYSTHMYIGGGGI